MALTLHLVRHGESTWNAEGRIQGQLDAPLSELGRAQAATAAAQLAHRPIGAVISSDLTRALDTARAIAAGHGLEVSTEVALRERHFGVVQGRLYAEAGPEYGDRWESLLQGIEPFDGGESIADHYARVAEFLGGLRAAPPAAEIVLVSHGGTVRRALSFLSDGDRIEDWAPVPNGAIYTVEVTD